MEPGDYEEELQFEIISWERSRQLQCLMEFIGIPRHIKLGMSGLVWSIQALRLGSTGYTFNIMEVKRSRTPLALSEAATAPDLPSKFKPLLVGFEMSTKSVFLAEEALDKLYAFSRLVFRTDEDKRWWIIADAKITAMACKSAREALQQAAEATAAILLEQYCKSPGQKSISGRSGWCIEDWTAEDELWTTSFSQQKTSLDGKIKLFQAKAVEGGKVLQWCSVQAAAVEELLDMTSLNIPWFEFEVAVEDLLGGDNVILGIGVADDRPLKVKMFLKENDVKVECHQEGVQSETTLGLGYLLPNLVRDYIMRSLQINVAGLSNNNVVEGLLQHVVRYLMFLGKLCVVCGKELRLSEIPLSSCCSKICSASKESYEAAIALCLCKLW